MNQNEFTIVLPSNSSAQYFPNNTTTNYSTRLPREVELHGRWLVGLSEIHIPCTTLHLRRKDVKISGQGDGGAHYFQHGTYKSVLNLVEAINEAILKYNDGEDCVKIFYDEKGGFVTIRDINITDSRSLSCKSILLSEAVKLILGFENGGVAIPVPEEERNLYGREQLLGSQPASLARVIPDQLFVYSNVCEPSIVGDTHAPLLRIVNLEAKRFNFGSTAVKQFAPVNYVPLMNNRFQTIDIDIRDQLGKPIPFEFGTLTAVLHFKKDF